MMILKKIQTTLIKMRTSQLIMIPVVLSLIPISLTLVISGGRYSKSSLEDFLVLSILILWGFVGLPMVIRKEAPWLITIRGTLAIIQGGFIMMAFWLPTLAIIVSMISAAIR